ncbi:mas-related G-protein coupled receptor member B4-like isoform X2 [Arvicola amphibius]|uniref:mas-related G-protein coupled receptor member B4-like isoform X2 n=1 Tax=Arvicola amphibius TaxID=1047088 RepID=UPI0018E36DFA|nr:mas-related G-protein coupled receptor member B4-like isoform X2 [Arvicola amphibius]
MEYRNASGKFPSMDPITPAWSTDTTTINETYYTRNLPCIGSIRIILYILEAVIAMVGLAGNAIVLWLLSFHIQRNAFSVYVLNLAGADFLSLSFLTVHSLKHIHFYFHAMYFGMPIYFVNVFIFAYLAGMCIIAAISAERCLSVLWPIWYRCQRPRHLSGVICALLWAFSLLLTLLLGNDCGLLNYNYNHSFCRSYNFITAAFVIVLSVVLCGSSLALLVRIFCGSQRIPVTRLCVTITFTVLVFLFFGLPFGIYWFLLHRFEELHKVFPCHTIQMTIFVSCINSCTNPIIYFLVGSVRHRRFKRQTLKSLLQRAMQDTPEEEGEERGSSRNPGEQETVWCSSGVSP